MAEPRTPQDHAAKKDTPPKVEPYFTFTAGGTEHTMPTKTADVVKVGFVRRNRHLDEGDFLFLALEELADGDSEILDAIDNLLPGGDEWRKLQEDFRDHVGAQKGE